MYLPYQYGKVRRDVERDAKTDVVITADKTYESTIYALKLCYNHLTIVGTWFSSNSRFHHMPELRPMWHLEVMRGLLELPVLNFDYKHLNSVDWNTYLQYVQTVNTKGSSSWSKEDREYLNSKWTQNDTFWLLMIENYSVSQLRESFSFDWLLFWPVMYKKLIHSKHFCIYISKYMVRRYFTCFADRLNSDGREYEVTH